MNMIFFVLYLCGSANFPATRTVTRLDAYGDPLPTGAIARLGTVRLRHSGLSGFAVLSNTTVRTVGQDGVIRSWDIKTGSQINEVLLEGENGIGSGLSLSPDGSLVVRVSSESIVVWDAATGQEAKSLIRKGLTREVLAYSPAGAHLIVAERDGKLLLLEWRTGKEQAIPVKGERGAALLGPYACACSPNGHSFAITDLGRGVLTVCSISQRAETYRVTGVVGSAISPNGKVLALCQRTEGAKGTLRLLDFTTEKELNRFEIDACSVFVFSPDGKTLACGAGFDNSYMIDTVSGRILHRFPFRVQSFAFSPDGKRLVGINGDQRLRMWDATTGLEQNARPGEFTTNCIPAISPDGRILAAYEESLQSVNLWSATDGRIVCSLISKVKGGLGKNLLFSRDGKIIVSAGVGVIRYHDVLTGNESSCIRLRIPEFAEAEPLIRDSIWIAASLRRAAVRLERVDRHGFCRESRLAVWDLTAIYAIKQVDFSGHICNWAWPVAAVEGIDRLSIVSTETGRVRFQIQGVGSDPRVAFSPDGQLVAVQLNGCKEVGIWEVASGRSVTTVKTGRVDCLAFGVDNRVLVSTGEGWLRVWDLAASQEMGCRSLRVNSTDPTKYAGTWLILTADGQRAVTNMTDGTALVWALTDFPLTSLTAAPQSGLETWWKELRKDDASVAYIALWQLAQAPIEDTLTFLKRRLKPAVGPDPGTVKQLISELGDEDFRTRESATEKLVAFGHPVRDAIEQVVNVAESPEVRRRAGDILKKLDSQTPTADALRHLRAIQILERIGSLDARKVLQELAAGASGVLETEAAKAAIERLGEPNSKR